VDDVSTLRFAAARLLSRLASTVQASCQEFGLTLTQYRVLVWLMERPMRAAELSEFLGVTRPAVTALLRGLEGQQLIHKKPAIDDRRALQVSVTRNGLRRIREIDGRLTRLVDSLVSADELARTTALLPLLDQRIDAAALEVRDRLRMVRSSGNGRVTPR
jgi:DNA-binding MarR family transcriptional regulator